MPDAGTQPGRGSPIRRIFPLGLSPLWPALFAAGAAAGIVFYGPLLALLGGAIRLALSAGAKLAGSPAEQAAAGALILVKNLSVAALCLAAGRPTRGAWPAAVCLANGAALGVLARLLREEIGLPYWKLAAMLAPHGAVELAAVFAACTAGVAALPLEARFRRAMPGVAAALGVAALIETWVSPLVGGWLA